MLRAIYSTGSSCILPESNDIDLVYYYDTKEERREALIKNKVRDNDIHFRLLSQAKRVFLGCYIYPFSKHIEGEEIDYSDFSIFDENIKAQYIPILKDYAERLDRADKRWYHIFIAVKMYQKGGIKLTKTELKTAQKIHDEGVNCDIYNSIIDYLRELK